MSLDRFINSDEIINEISSTDGFVFPNKWTEELESAGLLGNLSIDISQTYKDAEDSSADLIIEGHLYGTDGSYVDSAYNLFNSKSDVHPITLDISTSDLINKINVKSGKYIAAFNIHRTVPETGTKDNPGLFISEISSDRREIYVRGVPGTPAYQSFITSARL